MDDQSRPRRSRISGPDSVARVAAWACATAAGGKSGARPWARIASLAKRLSSSLCAAVSVIVYGTGFVRLGKAEESAKELPKLRVDYGEKRRRMANFDSCR